MLDFIRGSIQGFVKIIDKDTSEVLVDTHNDVLYGNISMALAQALLGNSDSFLFYMAFGNGGAYIDPTGIITYRPTFGGPTSLVKNPLANLYNTIYVKKVSNNATSSYEYDPLSKAYIPIENAATNYEDIVVNVTLGYSELPTSVVASSIIQQSPVDNSAVVGGTTTSDTISPGTLVFNEIGLFAGSNNIFEGGFTKTVADVDNFSNQGVNFSGTAGSKSKLMLTHVIFHPVQKSANRSLEIIYTLRIQMGAN